MGNWIFTGIECIDYDDDDDDESLSLYHRRQFSTQYFSPSSVRFKDFYLDGRFSSHKHTISLMNKREICYPNYTDDYHLNFTKFILTVESSTACSGSNRF